MRSLLSFFVSMSLINFAAAQQAVEFDYFSANRGMIRNGVQAVLTCNGLFTSNRSLEQVFDQELAYLKEKVGDAEQGNYQINRELKLVAVGGGDDGTRVSAVFRQGIGCVVMAPDQTVDDIGSLPSVKIPKPKTVPQQRR